MEVTVWYLLAGLLLLVMALSASVLQRLPLTTSLFYLVVGFCLGPMGFGLIRLDPLDHASLLERLAEGAVLVSLFSAGLKLRTPLTDRRWLAPVRLASLSMLLTVGLIALAGVYGLGLSWGAAILIGAILAPTDPVLASDVQVNDPFDRDRLRFALTGEAGLNDGTAFPFVMLGLGLMGLHDIGPVGWRWLAVDVLWATAAGLAVGSLLGMLVARLVLYLRRHHREAVGLDDFLALGLIALAYGCAVLIHAYGFLAVFAAGLALRRVERQASGERPPEEVLAVAQEGEEAATDKAKAPAYMAQAVLGFNEQVERIAEVAVVVLLGGMLGTVRLDWEMLWFLPLLLLVIRPVAVVLGLAGSALSWRQQGLIGWFGIRGVGSLYYLAYAVGHELEPELARRVISLTFVVVAVSVVAHGISVTPLMTRYQAWKKEPPAVAGT